MTKEWKDPLLQALSEGTRSRDERPRLNRPQLGWVGRVPEGADAMSVYDLCLLGDRGDSPSELWRRYSYRGAYPRVAFELNLFDWRPWGICRNVSIGNAGLNGNPARGMISVVRPGQSMGACWMVGSNDDPEQIHNMRAWAWSIETERAEGVYLTRRQPRDEAAA